MGYGVQERAVGVLKATAVYSGVERDAMMAAANLSGSTARGEARDDSDVDQFLIMKKASAVSSSRSNNRRLGARRPHPHPHARA